MLSGVAVTLLIGLLFLTMIVLGAAPHGAGLDPRLPDLHQHFEPHDAVEGVLI